MIDTDALLNQLIKKLDIISEADIPNIDLYMDQVTTFMDAHLAEQKRFEEDKILTKTMINNYAKNDLLPPPIKKRYSKNHLIMLIFIYYFKNMLSINDIKTILAPMSKNFFEDEEALQLKQIYQQVTSEENLQLQQNIQDIREKIETSLHTFPDVPDSSKEYLRLFSLIFSLSYDIYMKKQMLESIVDTMNELSGSDSSQKSEKKDKKSKKE